MLSSDDLNEIRKALQADLMPVGTIIIYSNSDAPPGYLPCDGRAVPKHEYPLLYAAIGNTFGEFDTTFNVPDLRGQFVRGFDPSHRFDSDCGRKFGQHQSDALQGHTHSAKWDNQETGKAGAHLHLYIAENWKRYYGNANDYTPSVHENRDFKPSENNNYKKTTSSVEDHTHTLPDIVIGEAGSTNCGKVSVSVETRPKNIALNFCIKAK